MLIGISTIFKQHIQLLQIVSAQLSSIIAESAEVLVDSLQNGNKILVMGNGGQLPIPSILLLS